MLSTSAEMVIYCLFIGSTICLSCYVLECTIDHFTVVCLVAWPLNESEARVDLVFNRNLPAFFVLMMLFSW